MNAYLRTQAPADFTALEAFESGARAGYRTARLNVPAMAGAALFTAAMVSSLFLMNITGAREARQTLAVVELKDTPPAEKPDKAEKPEQVEEAVLVPQPAPAQPVVEQQPAPAIPIPTARPVAQVAAPPAPVAIPAPPALPPGKKTVDGGDLSGNLLAAKPPTYPTECRRNREQGTVVLAVLLSPDGDVSEISVAKSSGFARLDKAALAAVRKWRWAPFKRDGAPVMVRGEVTIPFVLKS